MYWDIPVKKKFADTYCFSNLHWGKSIRWGSEPILDTEKGQKTTIKYCYCTSSPLDRTESKRSKRNHGYKCSNNVTWSIRNERKGDVGWKRPTNKNYKANKNKIRKDFLWPFGPTAVHEMTRSNSCEKSADLKKLRIFTNFHYSFTTTRKTYLGGGDLPTRTKWIFQSNNRKRCWSWHWKTKTFKMAGLGESNYVPVQLHR